MKEEKRDNRQPQGLNRQDNKAVPMETAQTAAAQAAVYDGRRRGSTKNRTKMLVIILAIVVVVLGVVLFFYEYGLSPVDRDSTEPITVTVQEGSGGMQILNELDKAGLVRNKFCGRLYVKLAAGNDHLYANDYLFNKNMSLTEIYSAISTGDPRYVSQARLTLIEGMTIPQAAEAIAGETDLAKEDILAKWADKAYLQTLISKYWFLSDDILNPDIKYPLEGYFYPETYFLAQEDPDIEDLTEDMLDKMDEKLTPLKGEIRKKLGMSAHEFLTFASIVERESLFDKDRAKIAGVFKNRLDAGIALRSDITVLYALEESKVNVSIAETRTESKYNTYLYPGLPVGPVGAVSAATMKDCVNYEKNDYLYFFATEDGKVLYSRTFAEHQKVVNENKWY